MHLDEPNDRPQAGNIGPIRREIVFEPLPELVPPVEAPAESPPAESPRVEPSRPAEPARPSERAPVPS